jgi:hypothetical protein
MISEIRIHLLRSRYWLQGVLISMLGSGSSETAIQTFAAVAPLSRLGSLQLRRNYGRQEQFNHSKIFPPLGRSSGGTTLSS